MSKRQYTSKGVVLNFAIALLRKEPELSNTEIAERLKIRATGHEGNFRMARRALGLPSDTATVRTYGQRHGAKKRAADMARVRAGKTPVPIAVAPTTSRDDAFKMTVIDALAVLKAYVEATI